MIGWLIGTRIGRALAGVGAALLAILTFGAVKKREGRKDAQNDMKEADHERAKDIRDNVDRKLDKRVRKMEGRGFRDR